MRTRLMALLAATVVLAGIGAGPVRAADSSNLSVVGVEGRTVKLLLTFIPDKEVTADTEVAATIEVDGRELQGDPHLVIDDQRPTMAVLALDTSGSMVGDRITSARLAAKQFLDALPPKVKAGLVGFNDSVTVLSKPTTDRGALKSQIDAIKPKGYTGVYDGVQAALAMIPQGTKARVLVLSDGQDNRSNSSLKDLIDADRVAGVPVDVVALNPSAPQLEALQAISTANDGILRTAVGSEQLNAAFTAASADYGARAYLTGVIPLGIDAAGKSISAQVRVGSQTIDDSATLPNTASLGPNPPTSGSPRQLPPPTPTEVVSPSSPWPFVFAALAAAVVLLIAAGTLWRRQRRRARSRLNQVMNYQIGVGALPELRPEPGLFLTVVAALDGVLARTKGDRATRTSLAAAGVEMTPGAWLLIRLGVIFALVVVLAFALGSWLAALVLGVLVGWFVTRSWLRSRAARRRRAFADGLPDFLLLIASGLRAGLSFTTSLESTAQEGKGEVARQMRRALGEVQLGANIDTALTECAERMDSDDLRLTVIALSIQREVGGNLSNILENAANTVKERFALRREVSMLSAEGRLSAYILIALPLGLLAFLTLFRREYVSVLWTTTLGMVMLAVIVLLIGIGWIWMSSVVRIKV
ncbi:MAG: type II secretion system F family protein [Actinomycetes bacterium]